MSELALLGGEKIRTKPWPGWPVVEESDRQALLAVLEGGAWGVGGPVGPQMVREFAEFHHAEHGIAVTNGTHALELALRACGIGPGCEVIVPPYTFIATASAPIMCNAIPVFADIDADTYCLDPAAVEQAITPHTKAIIGVHIGGIPCNMDALLDVARRHGLRLIEDCAQAHGAEWRGRRVGAIGDMGAFSFQSSKNVCAGEGGIVLTNDRELAQRAWSLANIGRVPEGAWYEHRILGWNLRLTEFQAALIRCGLQRLPKHMDRRDACGYHLQEGLDAIGGVGYARMTEGATRQAWHLFMGKYEAADFGGLPRAKFLAALSAEGIPVSAGYTPLYREGLFRAGWEPDKCPWACRFYGGSVSYDQVQCPVAEHVCTESGWWLPQNVLLAETADMDDITAAILKARENADALHQWEGS